MAVTQVTWDSVNKGKGVTLSNGNMTATIPNNSNTVRASLGRSTGKWYWEIEVLGYYSRIDAAIGIVNIAAGIGNTIGNTNARYYSFNGRKYNGNYTNYGQSYSIRDVISVLVDLDVGTIEFWKNGVSQGVAFTDIKSLGQIFPAVTTVTSFNGDAVRARFNINDFQYTMPVKYLAYDGSSYEKIIFQTSSNEYKSIDSNNQSIKIITSQTTTEQDFLNHGTRSPIDLGAIYSKKQYINTISTPFGEGKVFKQTIDTSTVPIKTMSIE